ncbi:MAG: hypothetical protein LBO67_00280 [Spirochaetaceae bacterium]|jgi:hypothetical protein|nr:hypothetical protein [Spirochaetaceae bacterium]
MSLLSIIPAIARARGFYLYTQNGSRIVDLWQDGGRAILGHKPPQVLRAMKKSAERALFAPFPHPARERFLKALQSLFPGKAFRLYQHKSILHSALQKAGYQTESAIADPAFAPCSESSCTLWRPFVDSSYAPVLVPVLPWSWAPSVLVLEPQIDFPPESENLSPALLAGATRALYNLSAALKVGRTVSPALQKTIRNSSWEIRGIYVHAPSFQRSGAVLEYEALFQRFLAAGFLLPPEPSLPLILPEKLSHGEEAQVIQLFKRNSS